MQQQQRQQQRVVSPPLSPLSPVTAVGSSSPAMASTDSAAASSATSNAQTFSDDDDASPTTAAAAPPSAGSPPPPTAVRRGRRTDRRNLLKNFYGIDSTTNNDSQASLPLSDDSSNNSHTNLYNNNNNGIKPWGADPLDIDCDAFVPGAYINKMLYERNLAELIRTDTELLAEIKDLDGEMKTLVYQNYNKFIAATDTIKTMKTRVESMEAELEQLDRQFNLVANATTAFNDSVGPKRQRLTQLTNVHNLLHKLNFVFELPSKLEQCHKERKHRQAVRYFMSTSGLLDHYAHIPIFKKISDECKEIIGRVGVEVRNRMRNSNATPLDIAESVNLLLGLNLQFPSELAKEYIQIVKDRMSATMTTALAQIAIFKEDDDSETQSGEDPAARLATRKMAALDKLVLTPFSEFVGAYGASFLTEDGGLTPAIGEGGKFDPAVIDSKVVITAKFSDEQRSDAHKALVELGEEVLRSYLNVVESLLALPDPVWTLKPSSLVQTLGTLSHDVSSHLPLRTYIGLDHRVSLFIREMYGIIAARSLDSVRREFFAIASTKLNSSTVTVDRKQLAKDAAARAKDTLTAKVFPLMESIVRPGPHFAVEDGTSSSQLVDAFVESFDGFWTSVGSTVTEMAAPVFTADKQKSPVSILLAARCLSELINHVEALYQSLTDTVLKHHSTAANYFQQQKRKSEEAHNMARRGLVVVTASGGMVPSINGAATLKGNYVNDVPWRGTEVVAKSKEIVASLRTTEQLAVGRFLVAVTTLPTIRLRKYIHSEDWSAEPTAPNASFDAVLSTLSHAIAETKSLTDDPPPHPKRKSSRMSLLQQPMNVSRASSIHAGMAFTPPMRTASPAPSLGGNAKRPMMLSVGGGGGGGSLTLPATSGLRKNLGHSRNGSMSSSQTQMQSTPQPQQARQQAGRFDAMLEGIGRLFDERLEIFPKAGVVTVGGGVSTFVLRIFIKAYAEEVRTRRLSRAALHRVQVDVEVLRARFCETSEDSDDDYAVLLDEVVTFASSRCFDGGVMDQEEVERIVKGSSNLLSGEDEVSGTNPQDGLSFVIE